MSAIINAVRDAFLDAVVRAYGITHPGPTLTTAEQKVMYALLKAGVITEEDLKKACYDGFLLAFETPPETNQVDTTYNRLVSAPQPGSHVCAPGLVCRCDRLS